MIKRMIEEMNEFIWFEAREEREQENDFPVRQNLILQYEVNTWPFEKYFEWKVWAEGYIELSIGKDIRILWFWDSTFSLPMGKGFLE